MSKTSPTLPDDVEHGDLLPRVQELERKMALLERLQVQINGSNGDVVFTRDNAVIRIGNQT